MLFSNIVGWLNVLSACIHNAHVYTLHVWWNDSVEIFDVWNVGDCSAINHDYLQFNEQIVRHLHKYSKSSLTVYCLQVCIIKLTFSNLYVIIIVIEWVIGMSWCNGEQCRTAKMRINITETVPIANFKCVYNLQDAWIYSIQIRPAQMNVNVLY